MASLKSPRRTPNWVLSYRDLVTGEWKEKTLPLRRDSKTDTKKAQAICRKATAEERRTKPFRGGQFSQWVDGYIEFRYPNENTRKRSGYFWSALCDFLTEKKIGHPQQIHYEHIQEYLLYRKAQGVGHNTARQEIKFLSTLMDEAVNRDYAMSNPLARRRIHKEPAKQKPDLTEEDLEKIKLSLGERPQWMQTIFHICAYLGCRISESAFKKSDVDFKNRLLRFTDKKKKPTHPQKYFTVPIPDGLFAYLEKIFEKQDYTVLPVTREQNRLFNKAISKIVPGASSHCLRVAFVTRCHRAELTESVSMKLVNHSNKLVHQIYSRLSIDDVMEAAKRIPPPFPRETSERA